MRIGIFSECYHPVLNGVVVSIDTFRKELEKRGHQFYIFTTENPDFHDTDSNIIRYNAMIPFQSKGGKYPIAWPQISRLQTAKIARFNLDLIHSQHLLGLGILGLHVGKALRLPTILTYHTLLAEYTHYFPILPGLVRNYLVKKSRDICNQYDQVVTPSPSMKKVLRSYGVKTPIISIPTGVKLDDFRNSYSSPEIRKKYQIPDHQKTILLYVSRIAKEKNVEFLFEAVEILSHKREDFHLLMVGGGPELDYYKQKIIDWGLKNIVTFTGMVEKKETNKIFGACDIFVFPSITETQGIVITEAMAAGIPAVAVNEMGPSDIIQDGEDGFLVPLNKKQFADKIEFLIDNIKLRLTMGKTAQKNTEKFSVKATSDEMENLYGNTISHHHS